MPDPIIIKAVLALVADIESQPKTVLDVSCRRGELLRELAQRGYQVRGTNFEPQAAPLDGLAVDNDVDLMRGLPYPDNSFDLVCLTEVIEHLENYRGAIAEIARVLVPGGSVIITTPNIMRLDSRLAFLLSGFHKAKRRLIPLDTAVEDSHRFHNYPIGFPLLYYLLKAHGLVVEKLGHGRVKLISRLLYPLLFPLVAANSGLRLIKREKRAESRELNRPLLHWMLSRPMLTEDNLIIRARKVEARASALTAEAAIKPARALAGRKSTA
jgi:SAM-dependent methyltransferase